MTTTTISYTQSFADRLNENKLTQKQQKYRNYANGKYITNNDATKTKVTEKKLQIMTNELTQINVALRVATGTNHVRLYDKHMEMLERHLDVQEQIRDELESIKMEIKHTSMQLKRVDRERFRVAATAISDLQYAMNLKKSQKNCERLEDRLDVSKKQEHMLIAKNFRFKSTIEDMLHDRALFNKMWRKMIDQLSYHKKFLIDRVEGAVLAFNKGADLCHKLESLQEKEIRDTKMDVIKMRDIVRRLHADEKMYAFLANKGNRRELDNLEDREYRRRQIFRDEHKQTTEMYLDILAKVTEYYGVSQTKDAAEKFRFYDIQYFGHFNYMNDLNDKIAYLNASLGTIHRQINHNRTRTKVEAENRHQKLTQLTDELAGKIATNEQAESEHQHVDKELQIYFDSICDLFHTLRCDSSTLNRKLGDNQKVTKFNVMEYLATVEKRLNDVLCCVYYDEQQKPDKVNVIVRGVAHEKGDPTAVEDIVLTQQCAECAEGEDVNRYDEETVLPLEMTELRSKVRVKVQAPEMRYRLHNLSKCVLPRSKQLVNKRYQ